MPSRRTARKTTREKTVNKKRVTQLTGSSTAKLSNLIMKAESKASGSITAAETKEGILRTNMAMSPAEFLIRFGTTKDKMSEQARADRKRAALAKKQGRKLQKML